jgi:hypothetical protein
MIIEVNGTDGNAGFQVSHSIPHKPTVIEPADGAVPMPW